MSTNQILFEKNKARPVPTVLGKPKIESKEVKSEISKQTNSMDLQNRKPSKPRPQSSDRIRRSSQPKIEIEQFLNPERKPSTARSQSSQISESEFTAQNYHLMPEIYRRTHPLAPGGGIRTPMEFGAPPPPEYSHRRSQSTQMHGSLGRNDLREQGSDLYPQNVSSGRRYRSQQRNLRQRTLPAFRNRLSPTRSRGTVYQNRLYPRSRRRRSSTMTAPNRGLGRNSPFASVDYSQMPEWFQRAHPQAPGGGLYAPPRSYAPQVPPEDNWFASQ